VERGEPGELRQGHVRLAVLPGGAGLVREVAEEAAVGGEIGPPGEDPPREPRARLVPSCLEIPAAHV